MFLWDEMKIPRVLLKSSKSSLLLENMETSDSGRCTCSLHGGSLRRVVPIVDPADQSVANATWSGRSSAIFCVAACNTPCIPWQHTTDAPMHVTGGQDEPAGDGELLRRAVQREEAETAQAYQRSKRLVHPARLSRGTCVGTTISTTAPNHFAPWFDQVSNECSSRFLHKHLV